ncbi:MAG: hypothetical protein CR986_02035 [Ignavibacteriae bacterium]|nr:MAG: hypothetical protein CR986_02035 [Ignavibacteriota bacterium]
MPFYHSLIAALLPMLIYLIFIWYMDKYEREPFLKVFSHFLWGALGAILLSVIFASILNFSLNIFYSNKEMKLLIGTIIIAPLVEEIVKSLYLFRTYKKNYFDNLTDGLVYGSAIGLGFGMTENLLYFITYNETYSQWVSVVLLRTVFSAVMHAIATATFGAFIAKVKFTSKSRKSFLVFAGLISAILIHTSWNFSVSFNFTYYFGFLIILVLIIIFLIVCKMSLKNEESIITHQLKDEFSIGSNKMIKIYSRQDILQISKNFYAGKDRKKFVNLATKLAFRKLQEKQSEGKFKEQYSEDIYDIRKEINNLTKKLR